MWEEIWRHTAQRGVRYGRTNAILDKRGKFGFSAITVGKAINLSGDLYMFRGAKRWDWDFVLARNYQ